jgi:Protein of unknown function (DUF3465)
MGPLLLALADPRLTGGTCRIVMKRAWIVLAVLAAAWYVGQRHASLRPPAAAEVGAEAASYSGDAAATAFRDHRSHVPVQGTGEVSRLLANDNDGSRHQRFILRTASGQTLLIAHNIDIAPRVDDLRTGDGVAFNGEYDWNSRGGVVHWTHRDPQGRHASGWLRHAGRTYQ